MDTEIQLPNFDNLGLNKELLSTIESIGYKTPTPIQIQTIPFVLKGKDVLGQAQTGTGKTAAFALPLLNNIISSSDRQEGIPQVLVLTPTRELAIQVSEAFEEFAKNVANSISTISIYGGQDYGRQISALRRGVQIVVGTAGRIMDHMRKGTLRLDGLKSLVLDEADEMLRMGFIDDVKWILSHTPESCQRLLFSATIPFDVLNIVKRYLRNPQRVQIKAKTATAKTIHQRFLVVRGLSKLDALDRILETEEIDGVIVFVKTKNSTTELADGLKKRGHLATAINGDMQQNQREYIIEQLKSFKFSILVATDVVARGLDVERISHVINYDLPQDNEAYIHRIGRTGRAGREGDAISLVYTRDLRQLHTLERAIHHNIAEMRLPNARDITNKRIKNFKSRILETINNKELDTFRELMKNFISENSLEINNVVAAVAFLAQGDRKLFVKEIQAQYPKRQDYLGRSARNIKFNNYTKNSNVRSAVSTHSEWDGNKKTTMSPTDKKSLKYRRYSNDMITYRIQVGRNDGVEPRNIVGAIANEAGIKSYNIGHIKLFRNFSTVDLPNDVPKNIIEHLRTVWVSGKKLDIKEDM